MPTTLAFELPLQVPSALSREDQPAPCLIIRVLRHQDALAAQDGLTMHYGVENRRLDAIPTFREEIFARLPYFSEVSEALRRGDTTALQALSEEMNEEWTLVNYVVSL